MKPDKDFTLQEILSQPDAWQQALDVLEKSRQTLLKFWKQGHFSQVIFTGCGSTYYLSLSAAALLQETTGIISSGIPASELWLNPGALPAKGKILLVAVSRSGETTETVKACEKFLKDTRGKLLTISCYPDQPLAIMGHVNLVLPSGQEQSIAQTRAFSALFLACEYLAMLWSGNTASLEEMKRLPAVCQNLIEKYHKTAKKIGSQKSLERFYFLGSGARYGLACELNLKMKEMSLSYSEAFHFMEFRHGPMSMVTNDTLIVGLVSSTQSVQEEKVLEEMKQKKAKELILGEDNADVEFNSSLPAEIRNVLYLPIGQLLAYYRALSRGLNPDLPHNLASVIKLETQL